MEILKCDVLINTQIYFFFSQKILQASTADFWKDMII